MSPWRCLFPAPQIRTLSSSFFAIPAGKTRYAHFSFYTQISPGSTDAGLFSSIVATALCGNVLIHTLCQFFLVLLALFFFFYCSQFFWIYKIPAVLSAMCYKYIFFLPLSAIHFDIAALFFLGAPPPFFDL